MKNETFFLAMTAIAVMFTVVMTGSLVSFAAVANEKPTVGAMCSFCIIASAIGVAATSVHYRKWAWGQMF